jgi:hypothetical protein
MEYTLKPRGSFLAWPSVALLCSNTRSNIATGHIPVQPLQQVQVSIRTCRNFSLKMKFFFT